MPNRRALSRRVGGIILQKKEKSTVMVGICTIPHDILTASMDKAALRVLSSLLILATILAFLLVLRPSAFASAHQAPKATPSALHPISTARPAVTSPTPTPTPVDQSEPGSTDGLVLMSFAIAVIIVIPILLQRGLWGK
jgi:hypothetical protein